MLPCACLLVSRYFDGAITDVVRDALSRQFACVTRPDDVAHATLSHADVIIYCMDDDVGLESLRRLISEGPDCAFLIVAAAFDEARIAACLEAGASDFLVAPLHPNELLVRVKRAMGRVRVPPACVKTPRTEGLLGATPAFTAQVARLPLMAGCDASVLITGETGTGKEAFARAIHYLSSRASRPWVAVNSAAIPAELMESELFGHVRGAYTNAHAARTGLVREAEGGTLFLDEIDCMPYSAQAKLLRFVQEKEYRPVGSNGVQRADVRIIAASNSDLAALVQKGTFRQDLYFRLNVLLIALPSLRERCDDIPSLAAHFALRFARQFGRPVTGLTPAAVRALCAYAWPGNIRELANVIERAVLMGSRPLLDASDFDMASTEPRSDDSFRAAKARVVDDFERGYIERLLAVHGGNVTHAAHAAKKNRRAFFELIRKHKIEADRFRSPS